MIQALARWRSDRSVAIYARLNPSEYSGWVTKAMQQTTTSRTVARVPVIDAHDAVATFQSAGSYSAALWARPQRGRALPKRGLARPTAGLGVEALFCC